MCVHRITGECYEKTKKTLKNVLKDDHNKGCEFDALKTGKICPEKFQNMHEKLQNMPKNVL